MEHFSLFEEPKQKEIRPEEELSPEDERERLRMQYGEEAGASPLTKKEAVVRRKTRDKEIRSRLEALRKKLGVRRKGDQEEIHFDV